MEEEYTHPCPACGKELLYGKGDYDICHTCGWEDDGMDPRGWTCNEVCAPIFGAMYEKCCEKIPGYDWHKHGFPRLPLEDQRDAIRNFTHNNTERVYGSEYCACFSCMTMFPAEKVTDWSMEKKGLSALCPNCHAV